MYKHKLILLSLIFFACNSSDPINDFLVTTNQIQDKLRASVELFSPLRKDSLVSPKSTENGKVIMVPANDWSSGFFAGELWTMYEITSDNYWKEKALEFTLPLEKEKWNFKTRDLGVKMYCSFGKAWEHTQNNEYRDILIQSAKTLATRFKPNVGCIQSWCHQPDKWGFPVTIENMMNLELLFWAANETGNKLFKEIAISHAETTMRNHFREDNSLFYVVDYNAETGEVKNKSIYKKTSGSTDSSLGQAWGLYGYTMVYRETGNKKFLRQAEKIGDYILNNPVLPETLIPYRNFNIPAAAVIASAFYELGSFSEKGERYLTAANTIFDNLMSPDFLANPVDNYGFILKYTTSENLQELEVDVPLIYADYYFVEMIMRKIKLVSRKFEI